MVNFSLLLTYRGLPSSWATSSLNTLPSATQMKLEKATKSIKERQKGGVVYISGDPAILLGMLWEEGKLDNLSGLDFPKHFDSKMDKDKTTLELNPRRYTFIYGVGNESAINKSFSGQLLKGLIETCRNDGVWCFVCGTIPKATFEREYGVELVNSITLPKKVEEKIL